MQSLWYCKYSFCGKNFSGKLILCPFKTLKNLSTDSPLQMSLILLETIISYLSDIVINPRSKALSYKEFKHSPFLGSVFSLDVLSFQGLIWLATKSSGFDNPVIQQAPL